MSDITDVPLWSDRTYSVTFRPNRALPNPHTVTDQKAWDSNAENRIRFALNRLCCEDRQFIEGIIVKRTKRRNEQQYLVNGDSAKLRYEEAVTRILELVEGR